MAYSCESNHAVVICRLLRFSFAYKSNHFSAKTGRVTANMTYE